jgi:hypothetical protein
LYKDIPTELVEKNYHAGLEYLRHIDMDQMGLGADSTGVPVIDTSDSVEFNQGQSLFGRGQLRDFVRDDDQPFGLGRYSVQNQVIFNGIMLFLLHPE